MTYNPFGAYLETKVLSASPLQLIHLAYEGAIDAVRDARQQLVAGNIPARSRAITKAQLLITELHNSLDYQKGGDFSVQLSRLYAYMSQSLTEANVRQTEQPLAVVQNLLETLDEAWREIASTETAVAATAAGAGPWFTSNDAPVYSRTEYTY